LDAIAGILEAHPEIGRIRVEGHTDDVGSAAYNKDLSQRRAESVVSALAARGVPRERLVPVGYGFERPVASNATALGRAKNRRVEFTIVSGEDVPRS
ncbi:MAG TPA: OmpA family protein, partial [Anaeromyxobacteraceae bacterium]|nr:OmpA family protein [Anaeromyxobacteraceae bacterium]